MKLTPKKSWFFSSNRLSFLRISLSLPIYFWPWKTNNRLQVLSQFSLSFLHLPILNFPPFKPERFWLSQVLHLSIHRWAFAVKSSCRPDTFDNCKSSSSPSSSTFKASKPPKPSRMFGSFQFFLNPFWFPQLKPQTSQGCQAVIRVVKSQRSLSKKPCERALHCWLLQPQAPPETRLEEDGN